MSTPTQTRQAIEAMMHRAMQTHGSADCELGEVYLTATYRDREGKLTWRWQVEATRQGDDGTWRRVARTQTNDWMIAYAVLCFAAGPAVTE